MTWFSEKSLARRVKRVLRGAASIAAIPLLLIVRILQPLFALRIVVIGSQRLGHLALEPEHLVGQRELDLIRPRTFDLVSFGNRTTWSNEELVRRWKRAVTTTPSWLVSTLIQAGGMVPPVSIPQARTSIHGPNNILDECEPVLSVSESEVAEVHDLLRDFGIDVTKPYVGLVIRDSSYYESVGTPENASHQLLNFRTEEFIPACEDLIQMGYQVVRLGSQVSSSLPAVPGMFDYANSQIQTPRLDILLAATCKFLVSTQTGPDAVALAFRRPVYYVDVLRFSQFFFGTSLATFNPVRFLHRETGRSLALTDIVCGSLGRAKRLEEFQESGFNFVRSTPGEISRYVTDYAMEIEGFRPDQSLMDLRNLARNMISTAYGPAGEATFGEIRASLGFAYLRSHGDWFVR